MNGWLILKDYLIYCEVPMFKFTFNLLRCNIKNLRKRLGLSQTDLAIKIGVSQNSISGIETGLYYPNYINSILLAKALGCKPEDLYSYYIDMEDIKHV